jgi:hypothetical protein
MTAARKPRTKGPPKADTYFKKLPKAFTIDDVRKVAGKALAISLAQWARAKEDQEDRERISEGGVAHFSSTVVFGEATPTGFPRIQ